MVNFTEEQYDSFSHIGIARKSGRYPWGSGNDPYQRSLSFKKFLDEARSSGMTDSEIAKSIEAYANKGKQPGDRGYVKITTKEIRAGITRSTAEIRAANQSMAHRLKEKGLSNGAIAERMGLGSGRSAESTVRGWLKHGETVKEDSIFSTANKLREEISAKPILDVGKGTHLFMSITETKLGNAVALLQDEGYQLWHFKRPQLGTGKMTRYKILTDDKATWHDVKEALDNGQLGTVNVNSDDGGLTFKTPKTLPVSLDSKRLEVRYGPDGGSALDGVIQLRRGVDDVDMGKNRYAQVRIAIDGTHYLKGMAMYADDLPAGVDVRFNTNKKDSGNKLDAMKPMKVDKGTGEVDSLSPFGATTHSHVYTDKKGNEQTSKLNMVYEEGDWDDWSRSLSSQMLSKQPVSLAKQQLTQAHENKQREFNAILSLTNPVVKKKLLDEFAESADSDAVHLKAAAMDRQATKVLLPINSIRPHEIYAPGFENGEMVALVRHPHGGPFEIPSLRVNNNNAEAKRVLSTNPKDAVAIHHSVASQLSGADFDGDTVLVIPNDSGQIKHRPSLDGLKNFDPKAAYPEYEGMTRMTKKNTQTEMGKISNLITDMTILGADDNELAAAIRHSMVVIDAEKHGLNYKQSAIDNGIADLKKTYQGGAAKGAATLISRSSSEATVPQRKPTSSKDGQGGPINKETGELQFTPTGNQYLKPTTTTSKRTGVTVTKTTLVDNVTKGTRMEFAKNAEELLSGRPADPASRGTAMEREYADYANSMKTMANAARKASVNLVMPKVSADAKKAYAAEVASLNAKLKLAQYNAPLERKAQVLGGALAKQRIDDNPGWDKDEVQRARYQALDQARIMTNANKKKIGTEVNPITDQEWEAIQAGAVAHSRLSEILANSDMSRIRTLATPRTTRSITPGQMARAKAMAASGRTVTEIAAELGIPRSTLTDNLKG